MPDLRQLCDQLYLALRSRPCNCPHSWVGGEFVAVKQCSRCSALAEYEARFGRVA